MDRRGGGHGGRSGRGRTGRMRQEEALTAAPVDRSDLTSPTRRRREIEECAAGQWNG